MKKYSKICGILFAFAFLFFCFTGCTVLPAEGEHDWGEVNSDRVTDNSGPPGIEEPDWGSEDLRFEEGYYDDWIPDYHGVRAAYVPDFDAETDDAVLSADRQKYVNNTKEQFQALSWYILTSLVGEYGTGTNGGTYRYEFFADTSYLDAGAKVDSVLTVNPITPKINDDYNLDTNFGAIEHNITGLTYVGEGQVRTLQVQYSADDAWIMKLGAGALEGNYEQTYINTYMTFVQMRLMEINLGLPATPYDTFKTWGSTNIEQKFLEYAQKCERIGIFEERFNQETIYNLIANEIIGTRAVTRDTRMITYAEPSYTYEYTETQIDPATGQEVQVPMEEFHYYDMNKNNSYDAQFNSLTLYKHNYATVINTIAGAAIEYAKAFPTYSRMEIMDVKSDTYFTPGEKGTDTTPSVLTNMDFYEYQSALFMPNKRIGFDFSSFYFTSKEAITIDVYLRTNKVTADGNEENIIYIGKVNTDPTQDYELVNDDSEVAGEPGYISYRDDEIRNMIPWDFSVTLTDEQVAQLSAQGFNAFNGATYAETYKSIFAGKLPLNEFYIKGPKTDEYDFSDKWIYGNMKVDFFEIIFDVKNEEGNSNKDYGFKFQVLPLNMAGDLVSEGDRDFPAGKY